jgi:acetyl esterase/lipase
MSYRLAPEHAWPAMPRDVASAFAWVKENISERGGNPDRVFLFGHSSGCLLSAIVSADKIYLASHGLGPQDVAGTIPLGCRLNDRLEVADSPTGFTRDYEVMRIPSSRVDDFLADSPYESVDDVNDAVPAAHVTEDLPPTLVLIAEGERFFPPILRDGAEFVGRALSAGTEADLIVLEDRRHMSALEMMVTADDPTLRLVVDFVESH